MHPLLFHSLQPLTRPQSYVRLYKTIFSGRKALFLDLVLGMHFCRGNFRSRHFSEGGYEKIAVRLFNQIDFDVYYLEYDTKRAGTLDAQKHLPRDKMVVLGLVTSKFPELEDVDVLEKRVREAAGIIASGTGETEEEALERICVSPQCGYVVLLVYSQCLC